MNSLSLLFVFLGRFGLRWTTRALLVLFCLVTADSRQSFQAVLNLREFVVLYCLCQYWLLLKLNQWIDTAHPDIYEGTQFWFWSTRSRVMTRLGTVLQIELIWQRGHIIVYWLIKPHYLLAFLGQHILSMYFDIRISVFRISLASIVAGSRFDFPLAGHFLVRVLVFWCLSRGRMLG